MDFEKEQDIIYTDDEPNQEFEIDNANVADWAIEKIKEEEARIALFVQVANEKIEDLKTKIADETRKSEGRTGYLKHKLAEYLDRDDVPAKQTKTKKTLTLPSGKIDVIFPKKTIIARNGKDIKTNENLINYCKENSPEFIATKESIKWADFKKVLTIDSDGNVIDTLTGEFLSDLTVDNGVTEVRINE